jgi:hypothetical protein
MEIINKSDEKKLTVDEEIAGGLINAVERGQDLEKAMRSFANAGYDIKSINEAAQQMAGISPQPQQDHNPENKEGKTIQKLPTEFVISTKKTNKKVIIVLMVISALFLVSAGLLGLFWDKLFP